MGFEERSTQISNLDFKGQILNVSLLTMNNNSSFKQVTNDVL